MSDTARKWYPRDAGCCQEGPGDGQLLWGDVKEEETTEEAKSSDCQCHAGKIYLLLSVKHNMKSFMFRERGKMSRLYCCFFMLLESSLKV